MSKKRTAEVNGQPDAALVEATNALDAARGIYADMQSEGLTREDIWALLCGLIYVALNVEADCKLSPRAKPGREKTRRPKKKGRSRA